MRAPPKTESIPRKTGPPPVSSQTALQPILHASIRDEVNQVLQHLGVTPAQWNAQVNAQQANATLPAHSPITGELLTDIPTTPDPAAAIARAHQAFLGWRTVPMPRRGELVRLLGEELRANLDPLGRLVTIEAGKILSEGRGEVQEMIDICVFATGLSRTIGGVTVSSERPHHRMMEQWHPLGVTGIISAFNFPVAVWSWNAALALVCGNSVVWKPSEKTPLTALATQALFLRAAQKFATQYPNDLPPEILANLSTLLLGDHTIGQTLVDSPLVPLVSATGSTRMGRAVGPRLAARFARPLLELGGNNAAIVCPSANLDLTLRAVAFSAMGTAGQRCTTLRRLLVHTSVYDQLLPKLRRVYESVNVGDPRSPNTLVGPLIDKQAFEAMQQALTQARSERAQITGGDRIDITATSGAEPETKPGIPSSPAVSSPERVGSEAPPSSQPSHNGVVILSDPELGEGESKDLHQRTTCEAFYVRPALIELPTQPNPSLMSLVKHETFAPILYVLRYDSLDQAIHLHNDVPQGLSSSIFTQDLAEAELFLSAVGSDCGIANVNIGPSGAEIGGAFGGEKETGGGRESGSDAWKSYMRRSTNTINYGQTLPLAQGVVFDVD